MVRSPYMGHCDESQYKQYPWLVGCNYISADAINQLEMWQADTFNPVLIDKELQMAEDLGFNLIRVYLHDLAYAHVQDWQRSANGIIIKAPVGTDRYALVFKILL